MDKCFLSSLSLCISVLWSDIFASCLLFLPHRLQVLDKMVYFTHVHVHKGTGEKDEETAIRGQRGSPRLSLYIIKLEAIWKEKE